MHNCGQNLAPGQNCTVNLTFTPVTGDTARATLTVSSPLSNVQTTIVANGEIPVLQYSPGSLDFGNISLPYTARYTVQLSTTGTLPVMISGMSLSGSNAADFILQPACPGTIEIYEAPCPLFITFQPSGSGVRTASLNITDNTAGSPQIVPLKGTGVLASDTQVAGALQQISVGVDGALWGINSSGAIYNYNPQTGGWVQAPGALAQISVGRAGLVWGLNSQGQIYRWNATGQSWDWIPGTLAQIAVGADGKVWGINAQGSIYRYSSQGWLQIPGTLQQIAVGFDGAVWGINSAHSVYHYNPGSGFFELVPGTLTALAVGADGDVWGIDASQAVYHFEAIAGGFQQVSGSLNQIAVRGGGNVWGVGSNGQVYQYDTAGKLELDSRNAQEYCGRREWSGLGTRYVWQHI